LHDQKILSGWIQHKSYFTCKPGKYGNVLPGKSDMLLLAGNFSQQQYTFCKFLGS